MKTILVPLDFSPVTRAVLHQARKLADLTGGEIMLIHILKRPVVTDYSVRLMEAAAIMETTSHAARRLMARTAAALRRTGYRVAERIWPGVPGIEIVRAAEQIEPLYLVIGSHGHGGLYEFAIGSTTRVVLKGAPCPVIVLPSPGR